MLPPPVPRPRRPSAQLCAFTMCRHILLVSPTESNRTPPRIKQSAHLIKIQHRIGYSQPYILLYISSSRFVSFTSTSSQVSRAAVRGREREREGGSREPIQSLPERPLAAVQCHVCGPAGSQTGMKIQCNACGAAEARVLCCADEAALCVACDEEVHAANKLAGKHQRVPLLTDAESAGTAAAATAVPKCDICQEASGYFFCLEDRALLCRDCDVAIHTVNSFVSAHQRFLLTGVQVGLDPADPVPPIAEKHVNAAGGSVNQAARHLPRRSPAVQFSVEGGASVPSKNVTNGDYSRQKSVPTARAEVVDWTMNNSTIQSVESPPKNISEKSSTLLQSSQTTTVFSNPINGNSDGAYHLSFSSGGNVTDSLPDWPVDEFFTNSEYGPNFGFSEHGSSKGDNAKLGSAGGSPQCRLAEGSVPGLITDEYMSRVPENPWAVPEVPSPPTASGLNWHGNLCFSAYDSTMFVPEITSIQSSQNQFAVPSSFKRRRREY